MTMSMMAAVAIVPQGAGDVRAGRIADYAARHETDRTRNQCARAGAKDAVQHTVVGAGGKGK